MKRRDLNLSKYHISKSRYRELYYYCLQYGEREAQIAELRNPSRRPQNGMPNGSGISDPTASSAINVTLLDDQNELIRKTAQDVGGTMYKWLLDAVTHGLTYNTMRMQQGIPCGKNMFQKMRHEFFFLLDQRKKR